MIARETVVGWLDDMGLGHEEVADDDYRWALGFRAAAFMTVVAHPDVDWDRLLMQVSLGIAEDHRAVLRNAEPDVRDRFLHDLRIALFQQPVGFMIEWEEGADAPIPTRLVFVLNVMEETLGRSGFFRRTHQLQSAALLGAEMFKKMARFETWP